MNTSQIIIVIGTFIIMTVTAVIGFGLIKSDNTQSAHIVDYVGFSAYPNKPTIVFVDDMGRLMVTSAEGNVYQAYTKAGEEIVISEVLNNE